MAAAADLEAGYRICAREVRGAAGNFYYAFRLLPPAKRNGLHALYRFCRGADDLADGEGRPEVRLARLEGYRAALRRTLAGDPPDRGWLILLDAAERFGLGAGHLNEVIDGCAADCRELRVETEADLSGYCYGVAGVVGLLSCRIFGYRDHRVEPMALQLGEAMQRTNILRDLAEDVALGRSYLPSATLREFGIGAEDLLQGPRGPRAGAYRRLMATEVDRARRCFAGGLPLVPLVERDSRGCPAALAALYRTLLERIEERGFDVQAGRVSLSGPRKASLALAAWAAATLRP